MFLVIFDDRTKTYFDTERDRWVKNIACATFFTRMGHADEVMDYIQKPYCMLLHESEDLSIFKLDDMVESLKLL